MHAGGTMTVAAAGCACSSSCTTCCRTVGPLSPREARTAPSPTVSRRITPHHTASHRITPHHTASHRITPHHTASHRIAPHRTASHRIAPHRTIPHHTPYHTAPHHTASPLQQHRAHHLPPRALALRSHSVPATYLHAHPFVHSWILSLPARPCLVSASPRACPDSYLDNIALTRFSHDFVACVHTPYLLTYLLTLS
jgi:hypothetical protein